MPLYLHAEFLPNIRQITLYVSLPGTARFDGIRPDIQLSESRKAVTVSLSKPYEYVTETIKLPARVNDASRRVLKAPSGPAPKSDPNGAGDSSYDFSFRMQVDPHEEALAPCDELIDEFAPWTADEMSTSTRIRCRECAQVFLDSSLISRSVDQGTGESPTAGWIWKDLPSGNWAEMMDFWHCHKPDPHEGHEKDEKDTALEIEEKTAQTKGYGADSHVVAISGTVFVDVATFLLAETDCTGLKKVRLLRPSLLPYCFSLLFIPLKPGNLEGDHSVFSGVASDTIAQDGRYALCVLAIQGEGGPLTGTGSRTRGVVILSLQMDFALWVCDNGPV